VRTGVKVTKGDRAPPDDSAVGRDGSGKEIIYGAVGYGTIRDCKRIGNIVGDVAFAAFVEGVYG
jgi:hypothetical protein